MTKPSTQGLKHLYHMQEARLRSGKLCSPITRLFSKRHFHHYSLLPQQSLAAPEDKHHASVLGASGLLGMSSSSSDGLWAQARAHFTELF